MRISDAQAAELKRLLADDCLQYWQARNNLRAALDDRAELKAEITSLTADRDERAKQKGELLNHIAELQREVERLRSELSARDCDAIDGNPIPLQPDAAKPAYRWTKSKCMWPNPNIRRYCDDAEAVVFALDDSRPVVEVTHYPECNGISITDADARAILTARGQDPDAQL